MDGPKAIADLPSHRVFRVVVEYDGAARLTGTEPGGIHSQVRSVKTEGVDVLKRRNQRSRRV
ncbi:MAG: hypothetical protein D6725_08430 [Planctomycetota bacterium]|nr:MAG: hypothetical protein D6725_08430 [Planctomycetota bacterium]